MSGIKSVALAAAIAASSLLVGCAASDPLPPTTKSAEARPAPPATEPVVKHWAKDARLRVVMDQISFRTSQTSLPKDLPQDPEEPMPRSAEWYFGEAALLAGDLAEASNRIPWSIDLKQMSRADAAGFRAEADTLHQQALELRDAASAHRVETMQRAIESINSTCISCHSRYRDFAGQLDLRDAKARGT